MQVTPPKVQLTGIENGEPGLIVRVHDVAALSMSQANGRKNCKCSLTSMMQTKNKAPASHHISTMKMLASWFLKCIEFAYRRLIVSGHALLGIDSKLSFWGHWLEIPIRHLILLHEHQICPGTFPRRHWSIVHYLT
jgi:hypothetical protein